ncbi:MAG: DUF7696 family protein [Gammaproteobacteria bacterium]
MIDKYSEEWRKECEARELLTWSLDKRRKQLDLVQQKRGWEARVILQNEMERLWKLQKTQHKKQESSSSSKAQSMEKQKQIELI